MKPRLLFIPLHYDTKPRPHEDWFNALNVEFDCEYYWSYRHIMIGEFCPDYIFIQSGAIDPDTLVGMKQYTKAKVMQWTGDARAELMENVIQYKGVADLTLLAVGIGQKEMYEKALGHHVEYMQQGVFNSFFIEPKELTSGKIVFIGNNYDQFEGARERAQLCEALAKEFGDQFETIGNGWDARHNNTRSIPYEQSAQIYNEAYISISHACFNDIEGYYSNRTLDIMAAGGCCLMRKTPDSLKYFGGSIPYYATKEECIEWIHTLLKDSKSRNNSAEKGQWISSVFHTFAHRAKELYDYTQTL